MIYRPVGVANPYPGNRLTTTAAAYVAIVRLIAQYIQTSGISVESLLLKGREGIPVHCINTRLFGLQPSQNSRLETFVHNPLEFRTPDPPGSSTLDGRDPLFPNELPDSAGGEVQG